MIIKMCRIVLFIDMCTHHKTSSKNVDLNIWAHARHSVSVMGHNQDLELAVPVLVSVMGHNQDLELAVPVL